MRSTLLLLLFFNGDDVIVVGKAYDLNSEIAIMERRMSHDLLPRLQERPGQRKESVNLKPKQ